MSTDLANLPPPNADNDMQVEQQPQGFFLPMEQIRNIAKIYHQFKWVGKVIGMKAPPMLDRALEAIAKGDMEGAQELQSMAQGEQQFSPYDIESDELPQPRIGERALTQDLARRAHQMYYRDRMSYREIAEFFTRELGVPVSHTTIATYIWDLNEEIEENKGTRMKTLATVIIVPAVIGFAGFLVGHFFFR